eukprot:5835391-Pyramimonas_sp.AAC.1
MRQGCAWCLVDGRPWVPRGRPVRRVGVPGVPLVPSGWPPVSAACAGCTARLAQCLHRTACNA